MNLKSKFIILALSSIFLLSSASCSSKPTDKSPDLVSSSNTELSVSSTAPSEITKTPETQVKSNRQSFINLLESCSSLKDMLTGKEHKKGESEFSQIVDDLVLSVPNDNNLYIYMHLYMTKHANQRSALPLIHRL